MVPKTSFWSNGERLTRDSVQQLAACAAEFDDQGHRPNSVSRTGQAWVEASNGGLDAIQHSFLNVPCRNKLPRGLLDGAVHGQVILSGGDEEIHLSNQAVVVHLVIVE